MLPRARPNRGRTRCSPPARCRSTFPIRQRAQPKRLPRTASPPNTALSFGGYRGGRRVVGTDVDPLAMRASEDNARANGVTATFVLPDALAPERFDVVVANILANPLTLLAPALALRVRAGGHIVLSGILESQSGAVAAAYAPWFTIAPWKVRDGWVLLAGERT